ncbi:SPASM domain-containing protein [Pseudoflavonifractor sp. P01025]
MHTNPFQRWMYCGLYSDGQYTVTPDCNVYKCWEHAGMDEHRMGEIGDDGSLVNVSFALYDWMSKNPLEDKDCRECVYLPACGGGCGVVSYNETGTYHAKGCFKVKGVLEKQIQRFALEVANKAKK